MEKGRKNKINAIRTRSDRTTGKVDTSGFSKTALYLPIRKLLLGLMKKGYFNSLN